ncbi:glycosyltransferase [Nodularia spumigena CS-591/12]|uniref:glycosyltransferase family 2 protein n=1 Tax=Nodularia spumigena TaxID=70799 RepID=UPI00232F6F0E|nr:glycosyltransferase [Nodularia spumigena]MDB9304560.1 glycosyltransferase [Nodularia spumigena CS-591/12]
MVDIYTSLSLSIVIPTYNREQVLIDTISFLLAQVKSLKLFDDLIIIDQTAQHDQLVEAQLASWHDEGCIKWIKLAKPNLTKAMNEGLFTAKSDIVLFTDDDIIPSADLLKSHIQAFLTQPDLTAVVGQVLQPKEIPEDIPYEPKGNILYRFLDFPFRSINGCWVENVMAGNLSVNRQKAISIGGFDESFTPPVASRFETEFAKRVIANGGKIWFEPSASINHLQAKTGGTRSKGNFLKSVSPIYAVGDYYYALRHGNGLERIIYILIRPFRQVRTKFHLTHPWWIPIKLISEVRAFYQAFQLLSKPPKLRK